MPPTSRPIPELLAPAGGFPALRAAVGSGADAVYLGLDQLNARRGAENFTLETLRDACRFAHLHDRKVYLTANVVILPGELSDALRMIDSAWAAGVDAVIVQDLGLLGVLRETLPDIRLHSSTQMNVHNADTLRALSESGIARVTLAREMSIAEISQLVHAGSEVGVEVECFVHGALCISYSGQCLLSSVIGGRSANRGLCAQPCRLPYELVDETGQSLSDVGAHLLSPRDLAGITVLPDLVKTGVAALKIEGRMKSAEYVALVTGVYRQALDRFASSPETFEVRDGEIAVLSEAFSRGFTEAYLTGERGNEMMSYRRPNNRGVPVGRVVSATSRSVDIALDLPLDAADTIEFWTSQGRFAQQAGPLLHHGAKHSTAPAREVVTIEAEKPAAKGDRVFRVRNAALAEAAQRVFADPAGKPKALAFSVIATIGQPLTIHVADDRGRTGESRGEPVEAARTRAITAEEIMEHVGRLGGTRYTPDSWDISLSPGVGVPFSALHRVRRAALEAYEDTLLQPWADRTERRPALPVLPHTSDVHEVVLVVETMDAESGRACLEAGADEAHVPTGIIRDDDRSQVGTVPLVPRVCHDAEIEHQLAIARSFGRGITGNLGALWRLVREGSGVQAHWSLNLVNGHAVEEVRRTGASRAWLSPELSLTQIAELSSQVSVQLGVAVVGRQELMVLEHCVLMAEGPCAQRCATCRRRTPPKFLRDRKGYRFPIFVDESGRTHVYNSVPLDVTASLPEMLAAGVTAFRVDAHTLSVHDAVSEIARVRSALDSARQGYEVRRPDTEFTTGHFFRGVR